MIKKQNLWFLTLFSLVLVLSIYYITMPSELFSINKVENRIKEEPVVSIEQNELLVTMRVNLDEERNKKMDDLKSTLTNEESTTEEKNNAYEQIKYITSLSVQEEELENKIKKEFDIECFIKIDDNQIKIVALKDSHDVPLANNIMKSIQKEFPNKVSITITFEK